MNLNFQDTITIIDPVIDEYGSEKIGTTKTVAAIVGPATGYAEGNNQAAITTDAIAYIDPADTYVAANYNRLEGMLVITSEGETSTDAWYRIVTVSVGRRSLTDYTLDHVLLNLSKTTPITSVS